MSKQKKYDLKPDKYLSFHGLYCSWESKVSNSTKHGLYKRSDKASSERVVTDCILSRVLNMRDALEGLPVTERTPKSKIIAYKTSSNERSGERYYYTVSRVLGLEGQPKKDTVSGNDLSSYLEGGEPIKPQLSGMFNALVDAVLVGRWDLKAQNLSAPNVKNFDMTLALGNESTCYSKVWNKKDFWSLVTGSSLGKNKKATKYKIGTTEAIAHAFTQTLADFGTRVNEYYFDDHPIYSESQKNLMKKSFSKVFETIKKDISANAKDSEEPTQTVLRIFQDRAKGLKKSLYVQTKNPIIEVLNELQKVNAPVKDKLYTSKVGEKLIKSLDKIERFAVELSNGKLQEPSPVSVVMSKRKHEENFATSSQKQTRVESQESSPVDIFGRMFYPVSMSERTSKSLDGSLDFKR